MSKRSRRPDSPVTLAGEHLGTEHPFLATSLNNLAELYRTTGHYTRAETLYQQALAIRRAAFGEIHPAVAAILNNLAGLYLTIGDYAGAEPLLLPTECATRRREPVNALVDQCEHLGTLRGPGTSQGFRGSRTLPAGR
jgi:hypothetical protein